MKRFAPGVYDPDKDVWELYYLPDDFSQAKNLAADQPQKLAELKELFWQEAERNRVLPLVGGMGEQPAAMSATPMWPRLLFRPPCRPLSLRASIASTSARKPLTSQISSAKLDEGDKP